MAYKTKEYTYNRNLTNEENLLLDRLFKLRLSHMAAELELNFSIQTVSLKISIRESRQSSTMNGISVRIKSSTV